MKYISIGLQCSVTNAIRDANLREYGYPFDWSFSPSKTTYNILNILINDSIENTIEYIINDYSYYILENNENNLLKTDLEIIESKNYTKEYFKLICKNHEKNYLIILEKLFNNYTYPIKYNKKELDITFDSILYLSILNIDFILITNEIGRASCRERV